MERIEALQIRQKGLITAIYGLENDLFVGDDLCLYNMEQQLHLYLKKEGFHAVVFYSSTDGFYAYGKEDLQSFMLNESQPSQQPVKKEGSGRLFDPNKDKRPMGGRSLLKNKPATAAPQEPAAQAAQAQEEFLFRPNMSRGYYVRKGRMAYDAIVNKILTVLDSHEDTAVIMNAAMSEPELGESLVRQLEERLRRISDNYHMHKSRNKLLINYHLVTEKGGFVTAFNRLNRSIFTTPYFRNQFIVGENNDQHTTSSVFYIGTPGKQEIRNLINRERLLSLKQVEWQKIDEICTQLSEKQYTIAPISILSVSENATGNRQSTSLQSLFHSLNPITFEALKAGKWVVTPQIEIDEPLLRKALSQVSGQEDMIHVLVNDITAWAKQPKRTKPLSFFSVGTSGVGKTFTTECIAEALKEDGFEYIRFNMTEFSQEHEGAKLIGSPPGYVGSNTRPRLFEALRKNRRLIICFDEIEKAHDTVITMLMNLLDAGSLTWNDEVGDFTDCIIVFTSNLMQEEVVATKNEMQAETGLSSEELVCSRTFQDKIRDIFKNPTHEKKLRPEFCGRIDRYLVYNTLKAADVIQIAMNTIRKIRAKQPISSGKISPDYLFQLAKTYAGSMYGARGLKKEITDDAERKGTVFAEGQEDDEQSIRDAMALYADYLRKPKIEIDEQQLREELKKVKGQTEIIEILIRDLKAWAAIPQHAQPLNFFAVGTSGVGKTFTAEQLALALKKQGYRSVIFSMTEYSRESDVAKLIGSAPGFSGSNTRPELFTQIASSRKLVICFDEIEKAHPQIMRTLMQLLDKGRLNWNGETGDFRDCIILFTSNLEQGKMVEAKSVVLKKYPTPIEALRSSELKKRITDICTSSESFQVPVEVWGRINRFLVYNPLTERDVIEVAIQESNKLVKQMYQLPLTGIDIDYLADMAEMCAGSMLGMRPLKDEVRTRITNARILFHPDADTACQLIKGEEGYELQGTENTERNWQDSIEKALERCHQRKYAIRPFDKESLIQELNKVYSQEDKSELLALRITTWFIQPVKKSPLTLFLAGSSGVGKTYSSQIIASFLSQYGYEFTDINMTEYGNEGDVWKLIGSATGYAGSDKKPLLRQAYDRSSKQVILFDEIEKAHSKIMDTIMRLMERGLITLNDMECDFSQCILIFTSNIAMDQLVQRKKELELQGISCKDAVYQKEIKAIIASKGFRPDILGRINTVAVYNPLSKEAVQRVAASEIRKLGKHFYLQINRIAASLTEQAANLFAGSNEGARPVYTYYETLLSEMFAYSPVRSGLLDIVELPDESGYELQPSTEDRLLAITEFIK